MSKGNDKKVKGGRSKPMANISSYKAAQASKTPAISPFSKKPGANQIGRKGA